MRDLLPSSSPAPHRPLVSAHHRCSLPSDKKGATAHQHQGHFLSKKKERRHRPVAIPAFLALALVLWAVLVVASLRISSLQWQILYRQIDPSRATSFNTAASEVDAVFNKSDQDFNEEVERFVTRKWAYAFLIGGCAEERPEYRGFLYSVIVAAQRLKEFGSRAEVLLMIQMSVFTNDTTLPANELAALQAMNIRVHYIPKVMAPVHEQFYSLVLEKFRILDFAKYSRILFMDADIIPRCNLDHLFELSEPEEGDPVLKENVVLAWQIEPANAGFFMLKPKKDDFRLLHHIIREKEEKALRMPFPHWDEVEGWGHKIQAPDYWRSANGTIGTNWTWHAVFADQGLLYHWAKYVKKNVSIIIGSEVENWGTEDGQIRLEVTLRNGPLNNFSCVPWSKTPKLDSPYRDMMHFTGTSKPWGRNKEHLFREQLFRESRKNSTAAEKFLQLGPDTVQWFLSLEAVENITNVTFDFSFVLGERQGQPPVGRFSTYALMYQHIEARARNNWSHYQSPT